ncbi:cytochrome c1-2, heme protein, mitochondrial-like [Vespa mandarinia]|uniref:cytochrome c1-2, heme protein, mitochondrial-like n=1 Tax=Vespa mandarinia TaxID=7446 RepID=UPI00161645AE|nr:cytochrome c1-2, heme protein, mitochondrial-like [Vespa mandarinia]
MATVFRRSYAILIRIFNKIRGNRCEQVALRSIGTRTRCENDRKRIRISLGVLTGAATTCGSVLYFLDSSVKAAALQAMPPSYPWKLDGVFSSLDHSAVRRGWQIYKAVCSACHSLEFVRFMDLVDVSHTKEEAVAIAAEYEIDDGPDEEGNYYKRPGRLADRIPLPFPNEEAARAANNGAYPPDLSYMINARHNGRNYVFSLLTGFMEPPAGITLTETQQFNPYFSGSALSMAEMLHDGILDYDDGTPATKSQMSKDIVEFLSWTSSQDHDKRKLMTIKTIGIGIITLLAVVHMKKSTWTTVINQRIFNISKDKCE